MSRSAALTVALGVLAASCAIGSGVEPASPPGDTLGEVVTTEGPLTTADPATTTAAVAVAEQYLDAWAELNWERAEALVRLPPDGFVEAHQAWADLGVEQVSFEITSTFVLDTAADIGFRADIDLLGVTWGYDGTLQLVGEQARWRVAWTPATIHPSLEDGDRLEVGAVWEPRASILAADGSELAFTGQITRIGVVPQWIEDLAALQAELEELAGVDPDVVAAELAKPGVQPDWFLPVGVLDTTDAATSAALEQIPGVILRPDEGRQTAAADLAPNVVGVTGPITAEQLVELSGPYEATDIVGRSGLEAAFETVLAGTPSLEIQRVNKFGRIAELVARFDGVPPEPVRTSLDPRVQRAAQDALAASGGTGAVVVVDTESGAILAAATEPAGGFDRALTGLYPPGSTFKIVTAAGLLGTDLQAGDRVACAATTTVGGREFNNAGDLDLGTVTLQTAFARSCNTTFAEQAADLLGGSGLSQAAAAFGFGSSFDLGIAATGGTFPEPPDAAGTAAAAIGQGRVVTSPLHMATVAAAVASGSWTEPFLVAGDRPRRAIPLEAGIRDQLEDMMRAVVTDGTGTAADIDGVAVHGKTGSAEFGTEGATHAWFVGYWDGRAFAVVVEDGGSGGGVAAPIAAEMIRDLTG